MKVQVVDGDTGKVVVETTCRLVKFGGYYGSGIMWEGEWDQKRFEPVGYNLIERKLISYLNDKTN